MLRIYFSGTGNSQYIARRFSERMEIGCHSIEENIDFEQLLSQTDTVAVCYPIYGSTVPRIMRDFIKKHGSMLCKKKLIIFCTQMCFSGDGARAFARLIPGCEKNVLYAEHFNMPNNICNIPFLPIREKERIRKKRAADRKIERVCRNIRQGISQKRGWSIGSAILGKMQNAAFPKTETKGCSSFRADEDCIQCGLCVKMCPTHNLELSEGKILQKDRCTLCYRCVNICPQKAATVLISRKPGRQYKGVEDQI